MNRLLIILTWIFCIAAIYASPVHECENEMRTLIGGYDNCFPRDYDLNIGMRKIGELADNAITLDEYIEDISDFCALFLEASDCLNAIKPVQGFCRNYFGIQVFQNTFITLIVANKHMCDNDNQGFLDFIANDGATCFTNNSAYKKCVEVSRVDRGLDDAMKLFSDANICALVNADLHCMHEFDGCQMVKQHVTASYESAKIKLNCT